jgi:hypothetical protein
MKEMKDYELENLRRYQHGTELLNPWEEEIQT